MKTNEKVSLAWVVRDAVEKYVANENLTAIERAPKR